MLSMRLRKHGIDSLLYWAHPSNVRNILERGILCYDIVHAASIEHESIAQWGVQLRRRARFLSVSNRWLHSYVPLYLVRRTPMLWAIKDSPRVCIRVDVRVCDKQGTIFTDGNAASDATHFFNKPWEIDELPWDILLRKRWTGSQIQDGTRKRCAEMLIPDLIEVDYILDVVCSPLCGADFPLGHRGLREDIPWFLEP